MAENEQTSSNTTPVDLEIKVESPESDVSSIIDKSPDTSSSDGSSSEFVPLKTVKQECEENTSEPSEENGNRPEKNGHKRIQTAPIDETDATSKKPRINTAENPNIKVENIGEDETGPNKVSEGNVTELNKEAAGDKTTVTETPGGDKTNPNQTGDMGEMDQSSDTEEYYLTVHNLPTEWTYVEIKNYLDQQCGHVDEMEVLKRKKSKNCTIRLTFQSIEKCLDVFKKLENKIVLDKRIRVKISDTYTAFPTGATIPGSIPDSRIEQFSIINETIAATRWRPDLDSYDADPEGLYGLRPEFLKVLGVKPPLNKTVHVTSFRCDKVELKEVMELAGNVLMCCVVASHPKYAKVMYSHPLEAVQAISMLNGQLYYGSPLKIVMDNSPPDSVVLPKGLANIGQGLGIKARPIRNIVQQYHRYANKQTSSISPIIFSEIDFTDEYVNKIKTDENPEEIEAKINEFVKSRPCCNILNPTVSLKFQNIDELECPVEKQASDSKSEATKSIPGGNNIGSSQDQFKQETNKQQSNSPQMATPAFGANIPNTVVRPGNPTGPGNQSGPGFMHPNMMMNPLRNPMPMPGPREPFFRPGNPQDPRNFRPRVPYNPPPMRPPFAQQRPPFGPPAGMRPQIPPANFNGSQVPPVNFNGPQIPPMNFNRPRANMGNYVTVKFSNLPPSTTFSLLCDMLAQCGQVVSVQLTTPGCAMATFGHPSHAERCFQSFNGMNMEGYIVEVSYT
ncbi:hypothetical protein PYW08_002564 [Mythimna loreyi]|uniref:Uncharacterized protein n=1 Tax=Mythimna loreyi TaxID=667449 RepID=A0ACC2QJG3_9NEOP|nr:hypothetical protein PYW08_002564 [Mythimna loreyi]